MRAMCFLYEDYSNWRMRPWGIPCFVLYVPVWATVWTRHTPEMFEKMIISFGVYLTQKLYLYQNPDPRTHVPAST